MPQIFHHSTNTIAKVTIFGGMLLGAGMLFLLAALDRGGYWTGKNEVIPQPIPFSHDHHVAQIGIDCRYCHTTVETAAFAGMPPTETCMNCHSQIWSDSPMLEPVRASYRTNTPIVWSRVHDLPDFVYFNHSVHVNKGVACVSCHGRVDQMPLMFKEHTLQMQWCLACHKNPDPNIRPISEVTSMDWKAPDGFKEKQAELVAEYHVQSMINCSTCHR
jgi:hypothetical protein